MSYIEQLADQYGLTLCVECGKCVAICPIGEVFTDYSYEVSPRGVIERILIDPEVPQDDSMWFCLTCDLCTDLCPAGVRFRDFVEVARQWVIKTGITQHGSFCESCGVYLHPQYILEYVKQTLGDNTEEILKLCPRCRRYKIGGTLKTLVPGRFKVNTPPSHMGGNQ